MTAVAKQRPWFEAPSVGDFHALRFRSSLPATGLVAFVALSGALALRFQDCRQYHQACSISGANRLPCFVVSVWIYPGAETVYDGGIFGLGCSRASRLARRSEAPSQGKESLSSCRLYRREPCVPGATHQIRGNSDSRRTVTADCARRDRTSEIRSRILPLYQISP